MFAHQVAAAQPLLIGLLLLWSSYGKVAGRDSAEQARRTALPRLVGETRAAPAYRAVGAIEAVIALALLLPPAWIVETVAAVALAAGFTGYLIYAKIVVPDASCGCIGASARPVGRRAIGRAVLLLATALAATTAGDGWWSVGSVAVVAVLVLEAAVFVMLSAELDRYWLLPLRRLRVEITHPLAGTATNDVPLAATQRRLLLSPAYRAVNGLLRSDIHDYWDDEDWRFVSYTARYDGRPATAVFAVPHHDNTPEAVRVAVVDETSGQTLYRPTLLTTA
ncbi:MauE/DoxX family redox-associated membrane protein [Kribbella sp. NPDC049227]|uniref:MauE/DoxX family redox-associated membrane protein n=1 Tax=Kribbella sp. NPDC049227 TaxID=3364113 RepID=UPI003722607B